MLSAMQFGLLNRAIRLSAYGAHRYFMNNLGQVKAVQTAILKRILAANQNSLFGRKMGFAKIQSIRTFREALPVMEYAAYQPYIEKQRRPGDQILTTEKIILYEPTGGTTGGTKFIPYTRTLKQEFQQGINTWLYDLYAHLPPVNTGQSYWSVSPAITCNLHLDTEIPVGFAGDAEYLGIPGRILARVFAVPDKIKHCKDYTNFRYLSALYLLGAEHLTLISVWNPTFLLLILDFIREQAASLVRDLHQGSCTLPNPGPGAYLPPLAPVFPGGYRRKRALRLEKIFQQTANKNIWTAVWPRLSLVSCWLDGESSSYAPLLERLFPGVYIQGKGLLATEGFISLPLVNAGGAVPAYTSHFLEFLPDGENTPCLITELEQDKSYQVIITTGGGLYRYNLKDRITVRSFYRGLPVIAFTGRNGLSDMVGEKLEYNHIKQVLDASLKQEGMKPAFLFFAPERETGSVCYIVYLEMTTPVPGRDTLTRLAAVIDEGLKSNFHYRYARELGQLSQIQIILIGKQGLERYYRACLARGFRAGDIKPVTVSSRPGWKKYFTGN